MSAHRHTDVILLPNLSAPQSSGPGVNPARAVPEKYGIQRNGPPSGGEDEFRPNGLDRSTIATRLRQSGYATGLVGKVMNGSNADYTPPGWTYFFDRGDISDPRMKVGENPYVN